MTRPKCEEHVAPLSTAPSARATRCLQGIMDVAHKQNPIELRGFGRFQVHYRSACTGHNPRTGDMLQMPARAVPAFPVVKAF